VQTTRIATRALQQKITNPEKAVAMAVALEKCCLAHGISFLSLGSTSSFNGELYVDEDPCISDLATALKFTSFSIAWQPEWDFLEAKRLAEEIFRIAELTDGEANFRFAITFNCKPGIPFFPAAEAPPPSPGTNKNSNQKISFSIGTENSGLLYNAFSRITADAPAIIHDLIETQMITQCVFNQALGPVEDIAKELESSQPHIQYLGIDTSIVPGLEETSTITSAFELLPQLPGNFGDSGTLSITERITRALQSIPVKRIGYCGVMLPVCEDRGLANAAEDGKISIQSLLQYSAVCGVGLDTVPVPGPGPNTTAEERDSLVSKAAAVILDVAALSQRLGGKQLSVRFLPVVGAVAGEKTRYTSPYLVDSTVMSL
jgi:uncharacterized protein